MAKIISAPKKNQVEKTIASPGKNFTPRELQEIEKLAYQFFIDRGCEHGHDYQDWIKAEKIVQSKRS